MMRVFVTIWVCWAGGLGWAVAGEGAGGRPRVIATILPVYCIAAQVAGDVAEVDYLVGAGGDAHDYQLTPRDRSRIERAQLLLMNGLGVEPWLKRVVSSARPGLKVVELSRGLEPRLIPASDAHAHEGHDHDHDHAHDHGDMNAHVWLDPVLMMHMVTNAMVAFQELDPANRVRYAANAAAYVERLRGLDATLAEGLQALRGSALVTFHDAFPYFARRYGLRVVGVIEEIPDVDPTPKHLARLGARIRAEKARAIFVEPRHARRLAERLGRDLGVRVGSLDTLETGPAERAAYEDGMRANMKALQLALATAPDASSGSPKSPSSPSGRSVQP